MEAEEQKRRIKELRAASEQGDTESMFLLGVAFAQGRGVERDSALAARWFLRAARRGHARAQTSAGYLYSTGCGVRHDMITSHVLIQQAVAQGDLLAVDMLARLRKRMNPVQIREAERRLKSELEEA